MSALADWPEMVTLEKYDFLTPPLPRVDRRGRRWYGKGERPSAEDVVFADWCARALQGKSYTFSYAMRPFTKLTPTPDGSKA